MWENDDNYNELSMGYPSNISGMTTRVQAEVLLLIVYWAMQESHDEERLMYKNLQFGNSANAGHNVKTLNVALSNVSYRCGITTHTVLK
jgi:hypothetical protein